MDLNTTYLVSVLGVNPQREENYKYKMRVSVFDYESYAKEYDHSKIGCLLMCFS